LEKNMTTYLTIAAEGVKRNVPPSFGIFLSVASAQKIVDDLQRAIINRSEKLSASDHFWVAIHLNGDPCVFNGDPISWK
jgi:hypothetical protein